MRFWRHPSGLPLALAGVSGLGLPLAFEAPDPLAAHLILGLDGMAGAAVLGYLAGVMAHWTGGRRPWAPGPVLAGLWALGMIGLLAGYPAALAFQLLAGLATGLPILTSGAALPYKTLALAPLALPLGLVLAPPGLLILLPAALILWIAGRALPAFQATEAARRGLAVPKPLPRWPLIALLPLGAFGALGAGLAVLAHLAWLRQSLPRPDPASLMLQAVWGAMGLALIALGAERLGLIPAPMGLHGLTMGAIGPMILTIAARATMLRPPGQALRPRSWHWAGVLLLWGATLARLAEGLPLAQGLWSLGWAAFLAAHLPALAHPAPAPVFSARR